MMIIDNFLSKEDWDKCLEFFKGGNWSFPPLSSNSNTTKVWRIFNPEIESQVGKILYERLSKEEISILAVKRVGINGATCFNESHIHVDGPPGDITLIWFGSLDWCKEYGGSLKIFLDEDVWKTELPTKEPNISKGISEIEYVSNRAVIFPSHLSHIPDPPSQSAKNILRLSVGLHLRPSTEWNYKYIPRNSNG